MKTTRIRFIGPSNGRANDRDRGWLTGPEERCRRPGGQKDAHSDHRGRTRDGGRLA